MSRLNPTSAPAETLSVTPPTVPALERLLSGGHASADETATQICRALCELLGMDLAFVTRRDGEHVDIVAACDEAGLGLTAGLRLPSADTFCARALGGQAPPQTAHLSVGPYADVPARTALGVESYAMVPLRDGHGDTFGTLCVLDRRSVLPDAEGRQLMLLMAGLLSREQELEQVRRQEAAASAALAQRAVELERSQGRYRSLVDEMRDIVVRLRGDGTVEFVNQAWTELTGVTVEDTLGKDPFHHVHPQDRLAAAQHLAAAASGVREAREIRFLAKDGTYRWMAVTGRALLGDDGDVLGFTGMIQDVTDRRVAEAQVRAALGDAESARDEAQNALAEAERQSRAKSEFLSRMSHELRTPLNAILGFGQLLELAGLQGEDAEHVELIMNAGRHLLELINEVLDVTRIESGRLALSLEPVQVGPVVADSLNLVRTAAAARRLTVSAPAARSTAEVVADPQRLTQVLVNLLSNAVKYNVEGGRLTVEQSVLAPGNCPAGGSGHGWLRISVDDTGRGIPAARLEDAFLPFERLDAESTGAEGSGVGLAVSKTLVEAMGGRLGALSEVGRGSTFYVDLPAARPARLEESRDDLPYATVLYVEDNRSNITLMQRVLSRRPGLRLVTATDGRSGLERFRELRPDLVLLDLHLPELAGDALLEAVRADPDPELAGTPVAMVTADLTTGTERRLLQSGATAFLSKPLDIAHLLAVIDEQVPAAPDRETRRAVAP